MGLVDTWLAPLVVGVVSGLVVEYARHPRTSSTATSAPTEHNPVESEVQNVFYPLMIGLFLICFGIPVIFILYMLGFPPYHPFVLFTARLYLCWIVILGILSVFDGELSSIAFFLLLILALLGLFSVAGWLLGYGFSATQAYFYSIIFNYMW
jgi:hypothetical protein